MKPKQLSRRGKVRSILAGFFVGMLGLTGVANATTAQAQPYVTRISINAEIVSGGYVQPVYDACQYQFGRDYYPWNGDRGCARHDGYDYREFSYAVVGSYPIGGGRVYCPGQVQDYHNGVHYDVNRWYNQGWRPQPVWYPEHNQQYGGYPPPVNVPDAPPLPAPVYYGP